MTRPLTIGEVSRLTEVPTKTIRYYEETSQIPPAKRAGNGYRVYGESTVHLLRFVKRARDLGFPLENVRSLLALWSDQDRASADVRRLAKQHLQAIERKINELETLRQTLTTLVENCHGDHRPDCPILDDLATENLVTPSRSNPDHS